MASPSLPRPRALLDRLVGADRQDVRADELGDRSREHWPRNFALQLLARTASKIGDVLASPRTVLPWLLAAGGAPAWTAGALTPLREAGALLPQAPLGNWMRSHRTRRGFWVAGALVQGACVAAIAVAAGRLAGTALGVFAVGVMVVFSLARAMASLSSKDVLGRTVPRGRRGRLTGTSASLAGALSLAAGAVLGFGGTWIAGSTLDDTTGVRALLVIAALGWCAGAIAMSRVQEDPTEPGNGSSFTHGLRLLRRDRPFRRFVVARGLLAGTVLAMPYTVLLVRDATEGRVQALGLVVIAAALARMLSGAVWGRLADRSSRRTMATAGAAAAMVLFAVYVVGELALRGTVALVVWSIVFFALGLAHTGIRTGRKTYVVDLADDDSRPIYVGVANTLMGTVLLASTGLSALASLWSPSALVLGLAVSGAAGATLALRLPEISELRRTGERPRADSATDDEGES